MKIITKSQALIEEIERAEIVERKLLFMAREVLRLVNMHEADIDYQKIKIMAQSIAHSDDVIL